MKSNWYLTMIACAMLAITSVGVVHAQIDPASQLKSLIDELSVIQAQLISLQSVATSLVPETSFDGIALARRGDRGEAVKAIQRYLIASKDLIVDAPTGYFGPLTELALKKFQSREGIPKTGIVDAGTIAIIRDRAKGITTTPLVPEPSPAVSRLTTGSDLTARVLGVPPLTMVGASIFFSVVIDNVGNMASPISDMTIFVDGNGIDTIIVPSVEPGASATLPVSVKADTVGEHTIEAVIDSNNVLQEILDTNNKAVFRATVVSAKALPTLPPIGHWKFDGGGGNEIPGGSLAEIFDDASFLSAGGRYGGYAFIRSSGDTVKIAHHSILDLPVAFTIEFWFRERAGRSVVQNLVSKGVDERYNFRIFREAESGANKGAIVAGYTEAATGKWKELRGPNELAYGVWHHVVFAKEAAGSAYYLDGNVVFADYSGSSDAFLSPRDIVIGGSAIDTDFDNMRIYSYALNAAQVTYVYTTNSPVVQAPLKEAEQQLANIVTTLSALLQKVKVLLP